MDVSWIFIIVGIVVGLWMVFRIGAAALSILNRDGDDVGILYGAGTDESARPEMSMMPEDGNPNRTALD